MAREPAKCRYCDSERTARVAICGDPAMYQCGTQYSDNWWKQSTECAENVTKAWFRVRKALEKLRSIYRYRASDIGISTVTYVVNAEMVDAVIDILEGRGGSNDL